ncbi:right-handed parallel beta-helix repeat-containing protein [Aquimarina sp. AU474]|uniref:right-handed parallel beta-helix repeat-containing protein n=1 Tax=Aquimarina sp. AU474 TaxID=2108529 RepID=UPI00135A3B30|nr:right-handed parallel beta-helix repeat-containing protein [Aquimarina sp. AU474]
MKYLKLTLILLLLYACNKDDELNNTSKDAAITTLAKNVTNCPSQITYYNESGADFVVNSISSLQSAINEAQDGDIVYIEDDAYLDFSDSPSILINTAIKLVSGRTDSNNGATLFSYIVGKRFIKVLSDNVTISGLTINGGDFITEIEGLNVQQIAAHSPYTPNSPTDGIFIEEFDNLTIENCEILGWSHAGVYIKNSKNNLIVNNYIHHNRRHQLGYGVEVHNSMSSKETNALISCNYFEYNRHDIAGAGHENESYEASYNTIGPGGNTGSHSFDMHGKNSDSEKVAGNSLYIHHNTFTNKQVIGVKVRGIPVHKVIISNNSFAHDSECEAIAQNKQGHPIPQEEKIESNFLVLTDNNNIKKYTFGKYKKIAAYDNTYANNNCAPQVEVISSGWSNYLHFLPGTWTNNGTDDLIAYHVGSDEMNLYKFKPDGSRFYSGYTSVSHGWTNYSRFLVGNWTNNGTDDLIAYHVGSDNMNLYEFKPDGSGFYSGHTTVSHGWTNYSHLLVGNWTNNGTDDLMAYHVGLDHMNLYTFNSESHTFDSGFKKVSHGWTNYSHLLVGNWTNNGTDDLIAYHNGQKQLNLYKFKPDGSGFYSGYTGVKSGLTNYKQFFTYDWNHNNVDDIIGITDSNEVYLLENEGAGIFEDPYFLGVFSDLKLVLNGNW